MIKNFKNRSKYLKRSTTLNLKKSIALNLKNKIVSNLKQIILKKRYYFDNNNNEKLDLLFDSYKYSIIKRMLEISELKRLSIYRNLKKKKNRRRIFSKILARGIAKNIKNELLLMSPELLFLHIKAKS